MTANKHEHDVHLAAYHAWRKAVDEYHGLILKIQEGDAKACHRLHALLPEIDALHTDMLNKARAIRSAS
jgi:hypothetical protein